MKVDVTKERVAITECHVVTEGEYCVNECEFQLPKCFEGLTVTAVFNDIPVPLLENKCFIPSLKKGGAVLGVYAYRKDGDALELVYSPKPTAFYVDEGSYTGANGIEEAPEISKYEEYCAMLSQLCENLISQIDCIEKASLTQTISSESTASQVPTASAVYEYGREIKEEINKDITELSGKQNEVMSLTSNALKGKLSGSSVVIDDISPISHELECKFKAKNLSSVSTTNEFIQRKDVTFNNVLPSGVYSFSAVVESEDTDATACLIAFTYDGVYIKSVFIGRSSNGERVKLQNINVPKEFNGMVFFSSVSNIASAGDKAIVKDIQLEKGELATEYTPYAEIVGSNVIASGKNLCKYNSFECMPSSVDGISFKAVELKASLPSGCYSFSARVESSDTDSNTCLMLLLNKKSNGVIDEVGYYYFPRNNTSRVAIENQIVPRPFNCINFYAASNANGSVNDTAFFNDFQIESGATATDYEDFNDLQVLTVNDDCSLAGAMSIYPTTTILPEQSGVLTEVLYNRDINKAFSKLENALAV